MKLKRNNVIFYFCLMAMFACYKSTIIQPFFDNKEGTHIIIIPLEPGTKIVYYELNKGKSNDSKSFFSIHRSDVFELTKYSLIIDLTKFAKESDRVYDICLFNDKGEYHFTYSFVFNKEKDRFEIFEGFNEKKFVDKFSRYIGFGLGVCFGAVIIRFLI